MSKRSVIILFSVFCAGILLLYGRHVLAQSASRSLPQYKNRQPIETFDNIGTFDDLQIEEIISETFKFTSPQPVTKGWFGESILIHDDLFIVGQAPQSIVNLPGSLFVYERHVGGANHWGLSAVITPTHRYPDDKFGGATDIFSNTLIVGSFGADLNGNNSGAAYLYERNSQVSGNWTETTQLIGSDTVAQDHFGNSVAIDNDTAVVGAWSHSNVGLEAGAVYVFKRDEGGANNWGEVKKIQASDIAAGDRFGVSVAIQEDTIIVGAHYRDEAAENSGAVYVYERNLGGPENWGESKKITPTIAAAQDIFGRDVAFDGNRLLVSASTQINFGSGNGSAFLFERNHGGSENWGEVTQLVASDGEERDLFGRSVSLQGDSLIISAPYADGTVTDTGAIYIFEKNQTIPNQWDETDKLIASDGQSADEFGWEITTSDSSIAAGGRRNDDLCPTDPTCDAGSVYLYTPILPTEVAIEKRVSDATAVPSQSITYTLVYTNYGPDIAFNTIITDLVPTVITTPSFTNSGHMITQTGSTPFVWELSPISPGESGMITISGIISPDLAVDMIITNTAVITNSYDMTPTNNMDTAVVQLIGQKTIFLPVIMLPAEPNFPLFISEHMSAQPVNQGDTFFTTLIDIPTDLPATGQFFLSSQHDQISAIGVDDELAILANGNELFVKTFSIDGQTVHHEIVEIPRSVIEQLAGETATFEYRDVFGNFTSASPVWLIWVP